MATEHHPMTATVLKMPNTATAPAITLRQRIADALTKPTTSAEVRACLAHTQADLSRIESDRQRAEEKAVDPLSTEAEATNGKRECEALRFDLERLTASESRLEACLAAVIEDEDQAVRREMYDAAVKARDEAAKKLRTVYPKAAADIQDALLVLAEAEATVKAANQRLPIGVWLLEGPETVANDGQHPNGNHGIWPLANSIRLPSRFESAMWPVG